MAHTVLLKITTSLIGCFFLAQLTNAKSEHRIGGLKRLNAVLNDLVHFMNESSLRDFKATEAKKIEDFVPADCDEARRNGHIKSGIYLIKPDGNHSTYVWCNMEVSNGWTVIQKRFDGSVDFQRTWKEYKDGFGNLDGDFWLGLENIYMLTKRPRTLRLRVQSGKGRPMFALYSHFQVNSESSKYQLLISGFSGGIDIGLIAKSNNGSFLEYQNGQDGQCGGWWWNKNCSAYHACNLNGIKNDVICQYHAASDPSYYTTYIHKAVMDIL